VKRPAVVLVEWIDSYAASDGWTAREESVETSREMITDPILSSGFLVSDEEAGIVVASSLNHHADDVYGAMAIPRSAIRKITQLRAAK
jgi:hypothetical protein